MSSAFALIRFQRTGNIYYGVYHGASDSLYLHICTKKDRDRYGLFRYICEMVDDDPIPKDVPSDLDDVDIYTDYGGGFYWKGKGSETLKMVLENLMPFEVDTYDSLLDGKPYWVEKFLSEENDVV